MKTDFEIKKIKTSQIKEAPYNPRKISEESLDGLSGSLKKFGYVEPIIWNKKTQHIVGGHQRFKVLKKENVKDVQVIVVDLDEIEEKALNLTLNNKEIQGEWDLNLAVPLLREIETKIPEFSEIKLEDLQIEIDSLHIQKFKEEEEKKEVEKESSDVPVCKEGDQWLLGNHSLVCGFLNEDSTSECDIIIKRWQKLTGKQAIREDGKSFNELLNNGEVEQDK
jgi:hypothetical protein